MNNNIGFFMKRTAGTPVAECPLPEGFRFSFYQPGDETRWTEIALSVQEFTSAFAAILYFKSEFLPYPEDLRLRCLFAENSDGEKVATATAWRRKIGSRYCPFLKCVAVVPEYQGLGLGKAVITRAMSVMAEKDGGVDFYLHTQTHRRTAIKIYERLGYKITAEKLLYKKSDDNYKAALKILGGG